jgi:serine/threonine protein kinase
MAGSWTPTRKDTLLGGRYSLRERIGVGGMATVWLADDVRLDRDVAVKLLAEGLTDDEAFVARFRREARIAAGLAHPNLVRVFDFDPDAPQPYLVMEYISGPNLATRLERGDTIQADRVATDLLSALGAIHRAGVVHRDVKPANVLLAPGGRALLTDFGIARPEDATSITQTGQMPGTGRYMAPELMQGDEASPRTDLYSAGVLLQELLSATSSPALAALAETLADPDPQRRPPSAAAALAELPPPLPRRAPAPFDPDGVSSTEVIPVAEPGEAPTRLRVDARRLAAIGALGAAVVLAALAIGLSGGSDRSVDAAFNATKRKAAEAQQGAEGSTSASGADATDEPAEPEKDADAVPAPDPNPDIAQAAALNDKGFALTEAGRPSEAVPVLRQSVAMFGDATGDINYAYALFNLGHALREAGRPAEAVPVLERRLEIPNQTEAVRAELEAARAEAGEKAPKPKKPKKVPPGQAKR